MDSTKTERLRVFREIGRVYVEVLIATPLHLRLPHLRWAKRPAVMFLQLVWGNARLTVGIRSRRRHTIRHTIHPTSTDTLGINAQLTAKPVAC